MNLQEQISRMQSMMGLNEISNPYSVTWLEPTKKYFIQELDELLGNEMRFSKNEFFHPQNYDLMYSIFPHTFKLIAEHSKGDDVDNEQEIKDILLDKEIYELMDDWGDFRKVLLNNKQSQREGFNLFNKGKIHLNEEDRLMVESDLGIKVKIGKKYVYLDAPYIFETETEEDILTEGKIPKRPKKFAVYTKSKTEGIKKVIFGNSNLMLKESRNCSQKTDKTTAAYWSCHVGRYSKQLGLLS